MKIIRRDENQPERRRSMRPPLNPFARFFEDSWDPFSSLIEGHMWPEMRMDVPHIDVSEDDKEVKVEANVAGYDPKEVEVELTDESLLLRGTKKEEKNDKSRRYHRREMSYGEFYREIGLPPYVDTSKATLKSQNGILVVNIPKKEQKGRRILKLDES